MNKQDKKNFGFKKVSLEEKKDLVSNLFSNVAEKYDVMNDFMSFGVHRLWKDQFCSMIPNLKSKIIDVAAGTGDISFKLRKLGESQNNIPDLTVCDINEEMLKICKDRAIDKNILDNFNVVVADAEKLPFEDNSFDYYTIAFGIRNVNSIDNVLKEAYRILKPTGKFLCLEFSKVENQLLENLYNLYSFNIIPKIGEYVANDKEAYQYLVESIKLFPNQEDFKTMIQKAGFMEVAYKNLTFGVASIHYGFKI